MSINKMVKSRMDYIEEQNNQARAQAYGQNELISTSVRIRENTLKMLDEISMKMEMSRSDVIRALLETSVIEALIALEIDPTSFQTNDNE